MVYSGLWRWSIFRNDKTRKKRLNMVIISKFFAADYLGYTGVLLPTGQGCEDPWVLASALPLKQKN